MCSIYRLKLILLRGFSKDNLQDPGKKLTFNLLAAFSESLGLKTQLLDLPINLINRVNTPALLQFKKNEFVVLLEIKNDNF